MYDFPKLVKNPWVLLGLAAILGIGLWVFWQQPNRVAASAAAELGEISTAKFNGVLQLQNATATQQVLGEQGTVELVLDGVLARRENARDALQSDIVLTTKTESVVVTVEGEVRFVDDKAFLFIKKSPAIFELLTQLKGTWLELPRGQEAAAADAPPNDEPFTNVERIGTEKINGKRVVKYQAVATEATVVQMMDSIAQLLGTRLSADQITNIRQSVQQVKTVPVELWIKRWSNDIEKLSAVLDVPGGNKVQFTLTIHERNQKVDITAPADTVSLEQVAAAAAQNTANPTPR